MRSIAERIIATSGKATICRCLRRFFADDLAMADKDGRIGEVRADPDLSLRAFWDIGGAGARADATAIWVVQFVTSEIRVLDYVGLRGQKVGDVLAELRHRRWKRSFATCRTTGRTPTT